MARRTYRSLSTLTLYLSLGVLSTAPFLISGQTWCGKEYLEGSPIIPPGGQFQFPEASDVPLLNFQCSPSIKPYLKGDSASIVVDTRITSFKVPGATPVLDSVEFNTTEGVRGLQVSASIEGRGFALGNVALNTTGMEFPISLDFLSPRKEPYTLSCSAKISGSVNGPERTYETTSQLLYLEQPVKGSVTKQDLRTGSLLVKDGNSWNPILPVGFYTAFDSFLDNVTNVDVIKARGMNVVHPVPTFDNMTAFELMLNRMEELGLWLIYDMRNTYKNLTSVTEQVNMIKDRPNLLLWYTADEPDGPGDPLNATANAKALINELDGGGYHPVSLALNCENHYFEEYSSGADVVLQDAYPIGINATFSTVYNTPCTVDYGCCGCDNCIGSFQDISTRVDEFKQRLDLLGRSRSTAVWSVPQAFGNQTFWPRYPTGKEWLVESIVAINHGSLGITPWIDPSTTDIDNSSSLLAAASSQLAQFLGTPNAEITHVLQDGVDIAFWTLPPAPAPPSHTAKGPTGMEQRTLMLVANTNQEGVSFVLTGAAAGGTIIEVLNSGASLNRSLEVTGSGDSESSSSSNQVGLTLDAIGVAGYIFEEGSLIKSDIKFA